MSALIHEDNRFQYHKMLGITYNEDFYIALLQNNLINFSDWNCTAITLQQHHFCDTLKPRSPGCALANASAAEKVAPRGFTA